MKFNHFLFSFVLTVFLTGCNSSLTRPSYKQHPTPEIPPTPLIEKTMMIVKDGAAILDRFMIHDHALTQGDETLYQYAIKFRPPFTSFDEYVEFYDNECAIKKGHMRNAICWNNDRSQIFFVAELYILEHRDPHNRIFLNVVDPYPAVSMNEFTNKLAGVTQTLKVIKFPGKGISRFIKLQQLELTYDSLASQLRALPALNNATENEAIAAAKTIHDALMISQSIKVRQTWNAGEEVYGAVSVIARYNRGNEICSDISLFRKEGISANFMRDLNKVISGISGENKYIATLCTDKNDVDGFRWRFVS